MGAGSSIASRTKAAGSAREARGGPGTGLGGGADGDAGVTGGRTAVSLAAFLGACGQRAAGLVAGWNAKETASIRAWCLVFWTAAMRQWPSVSRMRV